MPENVIESIVELNSAVLSDNFLYSACFMSSLLFSGTCIEVSILFQPHSQYMQLKLQYFFSVGSTFTPKLTPNLLDFIGPNTISSNNISNLILEN